MFVAGARRAVERNGDGTALGGAISLTVRNPRQRCYGAASTPSILSAFRTGLIGSCSRRLRVRHRMKNPLACSLSFGHQDSYATIAKRMGVTDKMVHRYAQSLQKKGYVQRLFQKRAPNKFDLSGFFRALAS